MSTTPRVTTQRLALIAVTDAMQRAELEDREHFAAVIDADIPIDWPPPLNDDASMRWVLDHLREHPHAVGWTKWYFVRARSGERALLIGNGGFAGEPSDDGTVEVGYSIVETHQRNGYAPEAVRGLLAWAFSHANVKRVIAHTLPELRPSIRVLEKCGFALVGDGAEAGTIRYELLRPR